LLLLGLALFHKKNQFAEKSGFSEKVIHDCIKNNTGLNFNNYLNELRLSYARKLLFTKGKLFTVEAIVRNAGFKSRNTFYNLFHEKYGINPGEVIKISRKSYPLEN